MSIGSNMKDGEWNVEGWAIYTLFSGGGSEPLSDFRPWATLRTLLGAREKSPPKRPAARLTRQGHFVCSRPTSRTRFAKAESLTLSVTSQTSRR